MIFFRRDINIGLSFISSLLISKILYDLYCLNRKLILSIILIFILVPQFYMLLATSIFGDFSTENQFLSFQNTKQIFCLMAK